MSIWPHLTALGGLGVTAPICIGIAIWLAASHCRRRALAWLALFGAAMVLVVLSKLAFIGWGIGVMALDFAGFSGHAARAGAVFPVAAYLLCRSLARPWRIVAVLASVLVAMLVAYSRVKMWMHSPSEAVFGLLLGLATAGAFIGLARLHSGFTLRPWLVGATLALLLVPSPASRLDSQQILTGVALNLSGKDRPYNRHSWKPARQPYHPPCPSAERHFGYICI